MPKRKLGCCEYTNRKGELAHVLGCCCDCDILDAACDRCLRCQSQSSDFSYQMSSIIADRLRIPWVGGSGAIQLQLDVFSPILIIPTLLVISITHHYVAWTVSILTPLCLLLYYRSWRNNPQRTRTRFFFSWGLVSVFAMAYVFFGTAIFYRETYLFEGMVELGLFFIMLYTLYLTKQDPGSIRQDHIQDSFMRTFTVPKGKLKNSTPHNTSISRLVNEKLDKVSRHIRQSSWSPQASTGRLLTEGGDSRHSPLSFPTQALPAKSSIPNAQKLRDAHVKAAASGCSHCNVKLPPRASHCNVCCQCYAVRDHHCIWLDQCIGLRNHRAFIVLIIMFLIVSIYGLHLTLTTICTPVMMLDFFLLPVDCRYVYSDLLGAIAYVSCCYTCVIVVLVIVLLIQQMILISQNITIQEFNRFIQTRGSSGSQVVWWKSFFAAGNPYDTGFRRNLALFLRRTRHEPIRHSRGCEESLE
ncbi:ZDHHC23 [Bugula neritina]|uniref:Palmitoyltransferase n=1 Tax=Bugula neritina TaxID=10212 RepID=A0A7J7ITR2_BUGNE|nr:ZDHHC23 [Bugula neritina]